MKSFFIVHQEKILFVVAMFLFGILAAYFVWGITRLTKDFGAALGTPHADISAIRFDIEGAKKTGLVSQAAQPSVAIPEDTGVGASTGTSTLDEAPLN